MQAKLGKTLMMQRRIASEHDQMLFQQQHRLAHLGQPLHDPSQHQIRGSASLHLARSGSQSKVSLKDCIAGSHILGA